MLEGRSTGKWSVDCIKIRKVTLTVGFDGLCQPNLDDNIGATDWIS